MLSLEEYYCGMCKRTWFIESHKLSSWDTDFGCPFGCDNAGGYQRRIIVKEINDAKERECRDGAECTEEVFGEV